MAEQDELAALIANGDEHYGWRIVEGRVRQVVVGMRLTVTGEEGEDYAAFKRRMQRLSVELQIRHRLTVQSLHLHRRGTQQRRPWAVLLCQTAAARLPAPAWLVERQQ